MNIDVAALKAVEREKGIPVDTVIEAIETALLTAYRHTDGAAKHARVGDRPQDRRGRRAAPRSSDADGDGRRASGTTPRTTSAGSPR